MLATQVFSGPVAQAEYRKLTVSGMSSIVHDAEHRRLFVSGNTDNDRVLVLNYDGKIVDSIGNLPGASYMVLDDGTLYVSQYHSNAIATIDAETRKKTGELSIEPYAHPLRISKTSNLLWASVDCDGHEPHLIAIDVNTGTVTEHDIEDYYPECYHHVASPTEDVLYTWEGNISATEVRKYRVGAPLLPTQPPTLTLEARVKVNASVNDVKVSPDGSTLYVAGQGIQIFRTSDLVETGSYPMGWAGVAPSPDGRYVGAAQDGWYEPDVFVYEPGSVRPVWQEDVAGAYSTSGFVYRGDAVLLERGARMFVVSGQIYPEPSDHAYVHVVAPLFPTVVRKGDQVTPVADGDYLAWADSTMAPGRGYAVVARGDGDAVVVSRHSPSAIAGGLDEGVLSYSRRARHSWDVAAYDLDKGEPLEVAGRVNTRADEFSAGISGKWLLFERVSRGRTTLYLRNRENGRIQRLASSRKFLQGGQVNGNWVVWTECDYVCQVFRWNISQGIVQLVPQPGPRADYAPSVAPDGTVFFARGGGRCGRGTSLMKWNTDSPLYISEGGVEKVRELPQGKDFGSTYYATGTGGRRILIARYACRSETTDVVEIREP